MIRMIIEVDPGLEMFALKNQMLVAAGCRWLSGQCARVVLILNAELWKCPLWLQSKSYDHMVRYIQMTT
jgi:hypothetical protein